MCSDDDFETHLRAQRDRLKQLLCEALSLLTPEQLTKSEALSAWKLEHAKSEARLAELRQAAIDAGTQEESQALSKKGG